jgi:bisphosphoglycerate-dependent phosphoglycerate mutase
MRASDARAGVCIVRVEVQADHLLITVTTNQALNRDLYSASAGDVRKFTEPQRALEAVAEFLRSYEATRPG